MNSSAKKLSLSFLAAAALGAASWMGCTVNSGTVDDVDGGSQNNNNNNNGDDKDSGTGTTDTDSGTTGTVGSVCQSGQKSVFVDNACQLCLENSCCTELKGAYDIPADRTGAKLDGNGYTECINDCNADADPDGCYKLCDDNAVEGVPAAYDAIVVCGKTNCETDCSGTAPADPDAGK